MSDNNKIMPDKYWLYIWATLALIVAFSYISEGLSFAIIMGVILSGIITLWLLAVFSMWFAGNIPYKIISVVLGGLFGIIAVIIIQFAYEKFIFDKIKEDATAAGGTHP